MAYLNVGEYHVYNEYVMIIETWLRIVSTPHSGSKVRAQKWRLHLGRDGGYRSGLSTNGS